jgi:3-methyl-2-oxobutanoate hydroxymethyltransferase
MAQTIRQLSKMKQDGEKIAILTAYDATFARTLAENNVDAIMVGDSLGMVVQGQKSTVPVTIDDMAYHASLVCRGAPDVFTIVDLPFLSYTSPAQALAAAGVILQASNAHMVKLEGGQNRLDIVRELTSNGVSVCGHLGLLPQSVNKIGGYRVQGRSEDEAKRIMHDAVSLESAGADLLVLECVPSDLARDISQRLQIPVIGIGAGADCDGQVLVLYDMLGMAGEYMPKFVKNYMEEAGSIAGAVQRYVAEVKHGQFPQAEHTY